MSELKQYNFDQIAKYYDVLELPNSKTNKENNKFLYSILKKLSVKSVLDISCGTGVQTIFLAKKGLDIVGVDISLGLLDVAKQKAKRARVDIDFKEGDMRSSVLGKFDAVISMYNSIGHVQPEEFENKVLSNVKENLVEGGVYIFDIFNYDFFKQFEGEETHDEEYAAPDGTTIYRETMNSVLPKNSKIHVEHTNMIVSVDGVEKVLKDSWDMQLFSADYLIDVLEKNGFEILGVYGSQDGKEFLGESSVSIMIVARKV